jgi:hypothetical protein
MCSDVLIWSRCTGFIEISEGTGDNLLDEDKEAGYVDYVNITSYDYGGSGMSFKETDKEFDGMFLLEEMYQDKFKCPEDLVNYMVKHGIIPEENYIVFNS